MIVTKTPLRISLFGGGSDIPAYYNKYGGCVITSTIDKYIRIALQKVAPKHIKVMYSQVEQVSALADLKHQLVKACLEDFDVSKNIEIACFADIPTVGTGLGSSSAFTVGLLKALQQYSNYHTTRHVLADHACRVEMEKCGARIGKQDQYAAAFGGFLKINFSEYGVKLEAIEVSRLPSLTANLYLINTRKSRVASQVLERTVDGLERGDPDITSAITSTQMLMGEVLSYLKSGNVDMIGVLLDETWKIKKQMTPDAVDAEIEEMYQHMKKNGATGGKILGAGGGGFMLMYFPQPPSMELQEKFGMTRFNFSDEGSNVILAERME